MLDIELTPSQDRAIVALMSEPTVAAAARAAKVGNRTLHTWLHDETFLAAYRRIKRTTFEHAIGLTNRFSAMAVHTLAKTMTDPSAPHTARVAAAIGILRFGRESVELDDVLHRVEDIENRLGREIVN